MLFLIARNNKCGGMDGQTHGWHAVDFGRRILSIQQSSGFDVQVDKQKKPGK